jgi:4,5-dihydroxyphthalate decarboxylase
MAVARAQVLRAGSVALASHFETGVIGEELRKTLAADPMAYGVKATRKVLETIASYVHAQGLTDRLVKIEELFAPATLDL